MSLSRWGFIYTAPGMPAAGEVTVVDNGQCRTTFVGVPTAAEGAAVAQRLVREENVQLIELCGGFGPVGAAAVLEAISHAVPVGVVAYGPESVDGVHEIFS
ncbi:DUF6506 family protein [Nocardia cyriacigeorgica]|uniref:DUF6506 family protein n=1 Tax=Nocardia cyriacigeorgica TaxID=135487 RepID=UPI0018959BEE|nr:DUF6506 family protein [Nocardia cyriacigeorgica]MBF6414306.1 hypothetical protein [Nocardia cyriacigeorgica]